MLAEPDVGHTMLLLGDMTALRTLANPPPRTDLVDWYGEAGGLRRRLRLLARAADVLATLHARGIVYGDPSPGNIMVSAPAGHSQVWLIDVDNLEVESVVPDESFATPGSGAPEVIAGRMGISSLSDAYAFAIIAFQTLALMHPLLGDDVQDGDPEDEERGRSRASSRGSTMEKMFAGFGVTITPIASRRRSGIYGVEDPPNIARTADILVISVPLTERTRGLVGAEVLAALPNDSMIVNISRGPVVDTDALVSELSSGRISAAVDVVDPEPAHGKC